MRIEIHIILEPDDECWSKRIDEAFNVLWEFCHRFREPESATYKAWKRITCNREFTISDVHILYNYAITVSQLAVQKYDQPGWENAPWRDSIVQNAKRLVTEIERFRAAMQKGLDEYENAR